MKSKSIIAFLSILIIILGVFFFSIFNRSFTPNTNKASFEKEITQVEEISTSDEVEDIEKDLNDTDLSNLEAELSDIESELN